MDRMTTEHRVSLALQEGHRYPRQIGAQVMREIEGDEREDLPELELGGAA